MHLVGFSLSSYFAHDARSQEPKTTNLVVLMKIYYNKSKYLSFPLEMVQTELVCNKQILKYKFLFLGI